MGLDFETQECHHPVSNGLLTSGQDADPFRWARTRLFRGAGKALAGGSGRWPSHGSGFVQF